VGRPGQPRGDQYFLYDRGVTTASENPDKVARKPQRRVLTDEVYEAVKALLMDHEIQPGSRINIDGLARQLDVSPTPVREALARLESDGLVGKRALVGYTASPPIDEAAFDALFDLRLLLEPAAARWAATRSDDPGVRVMRDVIATSPHVVSGDTYAAYRQFSNNDARFHDAIARASGNVLLAESLSRLHAHVHLYRLYFTSGVTAESHAEHEAIFEAITSRDARRAERAMRAHLTNSRARLKPAVHAAP